MRGYAACLQETWRLGKTVEQHDGCVLLNTGPAQKLCKRGSLGVGILLSKLAVQAWEAAGSQVLRFGLRVLATRLHVSDPRGVEVTIFLVSAYAPVSSAPAAERAAYAQCLQECIDTCAKSEVLVVSMDANASPGVRSRHDDPHAAGRDQVRGPHGTPHENTAGRELCTLLGLNELCLPATYFKKQHYVTWRNPCSKKWHQLDHFAVAQRDLKRVADAGRVGLPGKDSDHFAVSLRLRVRARLKSQRTVGPKPVRIDRALLKQPEKRVQFLSKVKVEMAKPRAAETNKVAQLQEALRVAGNATLAMKNRRQPGWYAAAADVLETTIAARNEAQAQHHEHDTEVTHQRLREARSNVKRAVRQAEDAWLQQQMEYIQGLDKTLHPAEAWKAITTLRNGKSVTKPAPVMMFNAPDGTAAKDPEESAKHMGDYIKKTFSTKGKWDSTVLAKVRQRDPKMFAHNDKSPTEQEFTTALAKLGNSKSDGDTKCPAEYYKAMEHDEETKMYLRNIIEEFWTSGSFSPPQPEPPPVEEEIEPDVADAEPAPGVRRSSRARGLSHEALTAIANRHMPRCKAQELALKPTPVEVVLPAKDETADKDGIMFPEWSVARMKLLPKKGNLAECKNWRGICLLDIASKLVSSICVARMQTVFASVGMEAQCGFTSRRGNRDGHFNVSVALQKRKEHGLATWALFIDLVKAFDTVVREALFAVMRKFGLPDHFINILIRLHEGATIKVKIGDIETEVDSTIGVRQGSCEGPSLFLFIIQAALETMDEWPAAKPEFCTRASNITGEITGANSKRKRGITAFELWCALFADDCALLFNTREDMVKGANYLYNHLRRFGLLMHIGKGIGKSAIASKTEAMYFPPPRQHSDGGDQSNFTVADGFVSFTAEFRYLGSIIHQTLSSDADVNARIAGARAAFGALHSCFFARARVAGKDKGIVFVALCLSILLYGSESWCLREDLFQRLRVFFNSCVRKMCRVTMAHVWRHRITTEDLLKRLNLCCFDEYYNSRVLRWAGHVARMPMTRVPRMLLTGWVPSSRLVGAPQMTIGRTINKALVSKGISKDFNMWRTLAQDRSTWRHMTHPAFH